MFKKTVLGIAAAAAITAGSLAGATSSAQAGSVGWGFSFGNGDFSVGVGNGYHGGYGYGGDGWGPSWGNPCRKWKRRYQKTGKKYYNKRYIKCLKWHY